MTKINMITLRQGDKFMKNFIVFTALVLLFTGCSKPPKPVELDSGSNVAINHNLITNKVYSVPQDYFLKNNNWTYNVYLSPVDENTLIKNDLVVKTFYLAHNADKLIILGYGPLAQKYKNYFIENGVKAEIEIRPLDLISHRKDLVNVLYFHTKEKR